MPTFSVYQILLLHFWILISYVVGRYSNPIHLKKNYIIYFAKTLFTLLISAALFLSLMWLSGIQNISFIFRSFLLPLLYFYSTLSFFLQIFISYFVNVRIRNKNKFLFLGKKKVLEQLKVEIKISNIDLELDNVESIKDIFDKAIVNYCGVLIEDENLISSYENEISNNLFNKEFQVLNLFRWCEIYMQRFPNKIITFSNFIFNDFKIKKTSIQIRIKRIADIFLSLILILVTSPFVLIASLIIKIEDNGPVLYEQIRNGYKGKEFKIYKLRTMKVDSEKYGAQWSKNNDARVTNIGKLLRVTRLDELPQMFNVLSGKMSLIGPRPERPEFDVILKEKIPYYEKRYDIKPGLSGWAQVNYPYGSSIDDSKKKLSFDIFYIKNKSIFLDFIILIKTLKVVFNFHRFGSN